MTEFFHYVSFFAALVTGSLWCFGVYAVFNNDHLLGPVADWLEKITSETFCRPLFGCPPCMASVHGALFGMALYGFSLTVLPYMICLCGLNFIIKTLIFKD
jgi:hypothetical protein